MVRNIIPNEDLITNRVINWSFSDRNVRVQYQSGFHEANPREAIKLCLDSANASSRTTEPRAKVFDNRIW